MPAGRVDGRGRAEGGAAFAWASIRNRAISHTDGVPADRGRDERPERVSRRAQIRNNLTKLAGISVSKVAASNSKQHAAKVIFRVTEWGEQSDNSVRNRVRCKLNIG